MNNPMPDRIEYIWSADSQISAVYHIYNIMEDKTDGTRTHTQGPNHTREDIYMDFPVHQAIAECGCSVLFGDGLANDALTGRCDVAEAAYKELTDNANPHPFMAHYKKVMGPLIHKEKLIPAGNRANLYEENLDRNDKHHC